ncbi:hypothetical protein NDU88_002386, partial [Pleurodeles waltl]
RKARRENKGEVAEKERCEKEQGHEEEAGRPEKKRRNEMESGDPREPIQNKAGAEQEGRGAAARNGESEKAGHVPRRTWLFQVLTPCMVNYQSWWGRLGWTGEEGWGTGITGTKR